MATQRNNVLVNLPSSPSPTMRFDAHGENEGLLDELERTVRGEVRFDTASRALYATDLSIYRQVPIGVVIPRDVEDVIATVAACHKRGVPILGRGCGTSLAGQTCNLAVVIDFSKHVNRLLHLDAENKLATVEPGIINDQLRDAAEKYQLTFGPDPATHRYCTLGGMLGNNSCGVHSVMAGRTVDNTHELDILTYDGERMKVGATSEAELEQIIRGGGRRGEIYSKLKDLRDRYATLVREKFPKIPRRVSGYNLDELLPEKGFNVARALVGTESTCVIILNAVMNLVHSPQKRVLLVIAYPDIFTAADQTAELRSFAPIGLECFQKHVIENMHKKGKYLPGTKLLPKGDSWLLVEFGADSGEAAQEQARKAMSKIKGMGKHQDMKLLTDHEEQQLVWHIREGGVGASRVPNDEDAWPSWEDAAVDPAKLGPYLRDFYKVTEKHGYKFTIYGHFGDGCVHTRITFDLKTAEGIRNYRAFMEDASDLVVSYGGSLSGEHGDGQAKGELLPKMYGPELVGAFREFKAIWDPEWKMNPGKVVDPYPLDSNLRLGTDYHPHEVHTHFQFPEDHGSFATATERCFGVGLCRRLNEGTMCPSFMVTREESYTTRGRAHLLFEMMRGDAIADGWRNEGVKQALDLCLSCKGCKGDCPVNVDMATYKSEFLSHYWEGRVRPRQAYAFGLVDQWARVASLAPGVVNLATQLPGLSAIAKQAAGMPQQRKVPSFAPETFQHWFRNHERRQGSNGKPPVILWPDTFNNYFHPEVAQAAVEVLEDAGYHVRVPRQHVCCGRPLYDYGMLGRAKSYLHKTLDLVREPVEAGVPVVVLEPSCAAVFRDELPNMLPNDEDGKRLTQSTFLLSEFLQQKARSYELPKLDRKAVVQGHCHHKSVLKMEDEEAVLKRLGLDFEVLDSGCCGMAGSFGFEKDKYDVSIACGERVLLPKVRGSAAQAMIIADGFSCREQISQTTDRHALHLAQVVGIAIGERKGRKISADGRAEDAIVRAAQAARHKSMLRSACALAGIAALGLLVWRHRQ
ncbi:MAG: FAD-linked oxidase C-terminal domain-containing protein [Acidobacteriaceae bacterium]